MKRKKLIKFRVDLGLKAKEVAEKLEISHVHYSNIETGKVNPTFGLMQKFEEVFKNQFDDIWELFKIGE